ncbi:MAG: signal peptide peptidase SppA [Pseudomonas sp.]|nr:signal peptide peptidase SppA [Pseudomonas sp.]
MKLLDIVTGPWAIQPEKLLEIQAIYATHLRGEKIDIEAVEKRIGRPLANEPKGYEIRDGVAVLPVSGVLAKRMNLFSQISGGASYEIISKDFAQAMADPSVEAIALVIDSPGGAVDGVQQLASQILAARGAKPIGAIADGTMASAAYWLGANADIVVAASNTTVVGSIGVVASHTDVSSQQEKLGVKTTEITAGKYKRIASQFGALTEEGRADIQAKVDYLYEIFVGDVAQARGVPVDKVLEDMADGRVFIGQQAVAAGLVDGVSTLDDLIATLKQRAAGVAAKPTGATMDIQTLKAEHPELVSAIAAEERARILAVEAQALPGHEALIAQLKADGQTSGPEAAAQVLAAERSRLGQRAEQLHADAPDPVAFAVAPADEPAADSALPLDQRAKAQWEASADLQKEFGGSFGAYVAYLKNHEAGRARVFGK